MPEKLIGYAVRHGQTTGNANGTFRGPKNLPLDEKGEADARALGTYFADKPISKIFYSPKIRTFHTARQINMMHNGSIEMQPVKAFSALNVGFLAGELKDDHKTTMEYFQQHHDERIPLGESINEFRERTQPAIKSFLRYAANARKPAMMVVHSSIIHELNHMITGDHNQTLVKPGGAVGIYHDPTAGFSLKALLRPTKEDGDTTSYHG